jgi:carbon storage regulator
MLVLSRKLGQRFRVGHDIKITVVKIDRNSVRIGIEAPGDVTVYREEIAPYQHQGETEYETEAESDYPVPAGAEMS